MASPELASTIRATPDHTSRERDVNRRYGTLSSRNLRPSAGYKDLHVKQQEQVNARETYLLVAHGTVYRPYSFTLINSQHYWFASCVLWRRYLAVIPRKLITQITVSKMG